jgi:hypothetical protein
MTDILNCLQRAEIRLKGEFQRGSNGVYLTELDCAGQSAQVEAVYKPQEGTQTLWDFPAESLARREVAAYQLSQALGWGLVPPTVLREDGPLGAGSLQWRVVHDAQLHYFSFSEVQRHALRPVALFDLLANNADRKAGHILINEDGNIQLIDQGLCFHVEDKLRSVVWDFAGQAIPADLMSDLEKLKKSFDEVAMTMKAFITDEESTALRLRLEHLLQSKTFPVLPADRRAVPYPLIS